MCQVQRNNPHMINWWHITQALKLLPKHAERLQTSYDEEAYDHYVVHSRQQGHFDLVLWSLKHDAARWESPLMQASKQKTVTHAKQSPLSYVDTSHSHLFTAIMVTCSGDCIVVYEIKPWVSLFTAKNCTCTVWKAPNPSVQTTFFSSQQQLLSMSYFTGSSATKQGQV